MEDSEIGEQVFETYQNIFKVLEDVGFETEDILT